MDKALTKRFLTQLEENRKASEEATKAALPLERKGRELDEKIAEARSYQTAASSAADKLRAAGAAQMLGDITESEWGKVAEEARRAEVAATGAENTIAEATQAKQTLLERLDKLQAKGRALQAARREIQIAALRAIAEPHQAALAAAAEEVHKRLQELAAISELLRTFASPTLGYDPKAQYVLKIPMFGASGPAKALYANEIRTQTIAMREQLTADGFEIPDLRVLDQALLTPITQPAEPKFHGNIEIR